MTDHRKAIIRERLEVRLTPPSSIIEGDLASTLRFRQALNEFDRILMIVEHESAVRLIFTPIDMAGAVGGGHNTLPEPERHRSGSASKPCVR
jgi:hypothetical protein